MTEIIPAILVETDKELEEKISALPKEINLVHIDVLEKDVWAPIEKDFEAHLMAEKPEDIIEKWADRGAKRIIVHKLEGVRKGSFELGLGVELHIPIEQIFSLLPQVDFIHLMSIREIGAQGRPFEPEIFDRIKEVKKNFPDLPVSIDGGVSVSNYEALIEAGADRLAIGSGFNELWQKLQTKK